MSGACCSPSSPGPDDEDPGNSISIGGRRVDGEMVVIKGGTFSMGSNHPLARVFPGDAEGPARRVRIADFRVAPTAVTNADWAVFAHETGYRSHAERFGWSFVFAGFLEPNPLVLTEAVASAPWWRKVFGANWSNPEGPGSSVDTRRDHPVVHVSWRDATAYARWVGGRLPTEAEWEYAALGGRAESIWPWGDDFRPGGQIKANIFEGSFPDHDTAADGFAGTAPVTAYDPNGYGLYNCVGNVWEWCADWFGVDHSSRSPVNPVGPDRGPGRVVKGGSYLCHDSYCNRYRISARTFNTQTSSTGNTGFRLAADV
ncbi:MAG: formylglycine-generating enzyme family protein [Acidimicrobiia bacterium]|nr:formylglycine-generating enzyme family protein [Acidimicrobiia bacterium]